MRIRYNGHSSFTITAADGTVIVTDPYEPGAYGGGIGYHQIGDQPDIVTVSHDHADHGYTEGFSGEFEIVRESASHKGIEFRAIDTFHDDQGGAQRGANTIFVFEVDGVTLCHLGDLGHVLSDEQIALIGPVDVLMAPIGGHFTIDPLQATDVFERLRPKVFLPMHYKTDKCGFPIAGVDEFVKGKARVQRIDSDAIEVEADKLPGEPEVKVLNHAC
ncbi:MAG: MBL fold metallo-hydrolase [Candidatus Alcyoniella australis]|nr:MBL fold metallo-hydrolase [Candidatus Alcyoniella australis]